MAIPTFTAAGALASSTAAITPAYPARQAGDLLIAFVETNAGETSLPYGYWLPVATIQTTDTKLAVYWRREVSGSDSAQSFSDAGDHQIGAIIGIRGAQSWGNPFNFVTTQSDTSVNTSVSFPAGTTTVNECLILNILAVGTDIATARSSGQANASLANVAERFDAAAITGGGGGLVVISGEKATAGSTGNTTATLATAAAKAMATIAIMPEQPQPKKTIVLTSGSTWTVPDDWNNSDNTIEAIGPGGKGAGNYTASSNGHGSGGGAYSAITNFSATPGASISIQIAAGGSETDTIFNDGSTLVAKAGSNGKTTALGGPGLGGKASDGVGSVKYSGGDGGTSSHISGAGGGGAAGPTGDGKNGGNTGANGFGGGGGGSYGSLATAGVGGVSTTQSGGAGVLGGSGPFTITSTPLAGYYGQGGAATGNVAGNVGAQVELWKDTASGVVYGPSGGGSGGGGTSYAGGSAGYGGGAGGNGTGSGVNPTNGGTGLIVITYTPSAGGGGTTTDQAINATSSPTVTFVRRPGKKVAATGVGTVSLARGAGKKVAVTANGAVTPIKRASRAIAIAGSAAVNAIKRAGKLISATLGGAVTTAVSRAYLQAVSATVGGTVNTARSIGKGVSATSSATVGVAKAIATKIAVGASFLLDLIAESDAVPPSLVTLFDPQGGPLNSNDRNSNTAFRVKCVLAANSFGKIKVTLSAHTDYDCDITGASVGKWAGHNDSDMVSGSLFPLLFGGSSTVTIPAGGSVTSDLVDHSAIFSLNSGESVIVAYDVGGSPNNGNRLRSPSTNAVTYYLAGYQTSAVDEITAGGFPIPPQLVDVNYMVQKIESVGLVGEVIDLLIDLTATTSAALVRSSAKVLSVTGTTAAAVTKALGKAIAATTSTVASTSKRVGKSIAAMAGAAALVSVSRAFLVGIAATATTATTLVRRPGKIVAAVSSATVSMLKAVNRKISVAASATVLMTKGIVRKISASVLTGVDLTKSIGKAFASTVASAVNIIRDQSARVIQQSIEVAVGATTALNRQTRKGISTTVSGLVASGRAIAKGVTVAVSTAVALPKAIAKKISSAAGVAVSVLASRGVIVFEQAINAVAASSVTVGKGAHKLLSLTITTVSSGSRRIGKGVAAVSSATVQSTKAIAFSVMVGLSLTASVSKGIGKTLSASLSWLTSIIASLPFVRSPTDRKRIAVVEFEARTAVTQAEGRTAVVPAANRTAVVGD